jgi:hypothetical protein
MGSFRTSYAFRIEIYVASLAVLTFSDCLLTALDWTLMDSSLSQKRSPKIEVFRNYFLKIIIKIKTSFWNYCATFYFKWNCSLAKRCKLILGNQNFTLVHKLNTKTSYLEYTANTFEGHKRLRNIAYLN